MVFKLITIRHSSAETLCTVLGMSLGFKSLTHILRECYSLTVSRHFGGLWKEGSGGPYITKFVVLLMIYRLTNYNDLIK